MASEAYDWRAAFFIIVPPGLCALVCIWFALRDYTARSPVKFDWVGFLSLSGAIVAIQLILDRGQRYDWFESTEIIALAFAGVLAFWVFVVHCLTVREPFLNPRLLLDRNFSIGILLAFVMGMLNFTSLTLFPTLLHDLRGYPDDAIGTLIAARGMGNWAAFLVIVQFTRVSPRLAIACGMAIQAGSAFWMAQLDINLTTNDVLWTNLLHGFGFGLAYTPMAVLAFSTLPQPLLTQGNAIFMLSRMLGSSLFISVTLVVFVRSSAEAHVALTSLVSIFDLEALRAWIAAYGDQEMLHAKLAAEIRRQSGMIGYINAFHLLTIVPLVTAPLVLLFATRRRAP
jgi:DHA2 family multidrug resistance protein